MLEGKCQLPSNMFLGQEENLRQVASSSMTENQAP